MHLSRVQAVRVAQFKRIELLELFERFERVVALVDDDVSTTMVYTHVLNRGGRGVRSPADSLGSVLEFELRGF